MKKVSMFYGGGNAPDKTETAEGSVPFSGDPLADIKAEYLAKADEAGYSEEEAIGRFLETPHVAEVLITKSDIIVDGYKLERLNPSVRAFYILVARHPEGLKKAVDPAGKMKDSFSGYVQEYMKIFNSLERERGDTQSTLASFDLDARYKRYRLDVNKAITAIEEAHPDKNLDLSGSKIVGTKCLKIKAKVTELLSVSEL